MDAIQVISIILLFLLQLVIPGALICWLAFRRSRSLSSLVLKLAIAWLYFYYVYHTGRWDFLSIYSRYIIGAGLGFASVKAAWPVARLPLLPANSIWPWIRLAIQSIVTLVLIMIVILMADGFRPREKGIDIAFPLKHGFIAHGGSSVALNYHHADPTAQQYALDIGALNAWGFRAAGFFPDKLERYAVYGDTIFSPCNGRIKEMKDGLDNMPPGNTDTANLAGNYIIIDHDTSLIMLAHLLKGSLMIAAGDSVVTGQPIARVGNSGHTTEPHLHMHAIAGDQPSAILNGNGIPIRFRGKYPVRNQVFRK